MEGGLVLIPSTAGLTAGTTLTSNGLTMSTGETVSLTSVPLTMATLQNIPAHDIVAAAAAHAIHNATANDDDDDDDLGGDDLTEGTDEIQDDEEGINIEIKTEPPPLEAPPQLHPVTLQAHQIQTATLLPAHTVIEMLPQNLIEHQHLLQQQQQQLQAQQQQLQQYQQQIELQQQQQQEQEQKKTGGKGGKVKKEVNIGMIDTSGDGNGRCLSLLRQFSVHTTHVDYVTQVIYMIFHL